MSDVDFSNLAENHFEDFIKETHIADKTLIAFLQDADHDTKDLAHYQQYLIDTGKATFTFTSFTTKAGTALKGLGSALGSMAVMWAISETISLVVTSIDNYIHRVDKAKESLENSTSTLNTTTSELQSLNDELSTSQDRSKELQELADNGSISIADKEELKSLKETNKELERKIALKQAEQIQAEKEVLEDANDLADKSVKSIYAENNLAYVTSDKELIAAINAYNAYLESLDKYPEDSDYWQKRLNSTSDRITEMYDNISPSIAAYENLINLGYELSDEEQTRYEQLKKAQDEYLLYNYIVNGTKEAYKGLNAEQQRNIVLNHLLEKGLSDIQAQSVLNNISDDDLDELWDKDFSFTPPEFTDYASAEEYGKAYAEAWLNGISEGTKEEASDYIPTLLPISSTIDQLNTRLKPAFDSLKSAYQGIFTDDGFDLNSIDILSTCAAIKSELKELDEIDGITVDYSSYDDFVKVLTNSESTEQDVENAFQNLATTISNVSITGAEDLEVLLSVLSNLGVKNNDVVAFHALTQNTEALKEVGLDLANATDEQIEGFVEENKWIKNEEQAFLDLYLAKLSLSDHPLTQKEEILNLIGLAETAGIASESLAILQNGLTGQYKSEEQFRKDLQKIFSVNLDWKEKAEEDAKTYSSSFMSSFESEMAKISEKSFYINGSLYFTMNTEDILGTIESIKSLADEIGSEIDFSDIHSVDDLNAKLEDLEEQYIDTYVSGLKLEDTDLSHMLKRSIRTCIEMKAHLESVNTSLDTMQSNYSDLMDAIETYNQTGFISIDQLQTLLEMDDQYVALLIDEGDQLRFNEEGYKAIFKAKIDEAKALALEQYNTSIARLETEAHQRALNESSKDGGVISRFIDKLKEMGRTVVESSGFLSWMKDRILDVKNAADATVNNTAYTPPSYGAWDAQFDQEAKQAEYALKVRLKAIDDIWNAAQNSNNWGSLFGGTSSDASSSENAVNEAEETFDWIETAIRRMEESISRLSSTASSAYKTFSARNKALLSEMTSVRSEITLQQQAYNRYMQQANAVGLPSAWASKVQNGAIDISTITDENLSDQISEYQDWYEKAVACKDAITDLNETLGDLYSSAFDNVLSEYDTIISAIEHKQSMIETAISQTEEKGYLVSTKYYQALIKTEQENLIQLQKEKTALTNSLNTAVSSGAIPKASEEWYDMVSQINEVTLAIEEANTAMIGYSNSIRDIEWEVFDLLQDRISRIADESDFLIDLMSNDTLYDDRGQLTNEGLSTMGLHGLDYNVYTAQAEQYAKELQSIDKLLAKDPYSQDLIDRREELLELQQEMILAANDEKQAIADMVEEGIELELSSLKELIDTYTDALDAQKDLYDYQKNISEQTKNIASLQKQLSAYEGDISEETRAKVQQIRVSLDEAQEELAETQYDQYISDQKALLDELYNEYELILNQRLDNVDALVSDMITEINNGASIISATLAEKSEAVGYTLSGNMSSIWNTSTGATNQVLTAYGENITNGISSAATTLNGTLTTINANIQNMLGQLNAAAGTKTASVNTSNTSSTANTGSSGSANSTSKSGGSGSKTVTSSGSSAWGSWFIKKNDSFPKAQLNILTSIVDRLKYFNFDSSFSARTKYFSAMGGAGTYTGSAAQNVWLLDQMKAHGYKNGVYNLSRDTFAWTQEGRKTEAIIRPADGAILTPLAQGDSVLKAAATSNLFQFANNPNQFILDSLSALPNMTTPQLQSIGDTTYEVAISIDKVQDYDDFISKMKSDRRFEKMLQSMTIDRTVGKSSLRKYNV